MTMIMTIMTIMAIMTFMTIMTIVAMTTIITMTNDYGCHHKSDDYDRMTITDMCPEVDLSSACSSSLATQEGHLQET